MPILTVTVFIDGASIKSIVHSGWSKLLYKHSNVKTDFKDPF